jgi:uncharacterized protein YoxC
MTLAHDAGAWLLQQTATLPDTIVTIQAATERGWFEILTGSASIAISIALLALAVGLIPAAWNFRASYKKANDLLDKVYADVTPLVRHAHSVADNLDYITTAVRTDLQRVSRTINTANERLLDAVRESESRLAEFNALLRVMQEEAEDVFVTTASAVRGVREGATTLGRKVGTDGGAMQRARLEERLAQLEALAAESAYPPLVPDVDDHEVDDDGDWDRDDDRLDDRLDDAIGERGGDAAERPRIRPRPRHGA